MSNVCICYNFSKNRVQHVINFNSRSSIATLNDLIRRQHNIPDTLKIDLYISAPSSHSGRGFIPFSNTAAHYSKSLQTLLLSSDEDLFDDVILGDENLHLVVKTCDVSAPLPAPCQPSSTHHKLHRPYV